MSISLRYLYTDSHLSSLTPEIWLLKIFETFLALYIMQLSGSNERKNLSKQSVISF